MPVRGVAPTGSSAIALGALGMLAVPYVIGATATFVSGPAVFAAIGAAVSVSTGRRQVVLPSRSRQIMLPSRPRRVYIDDD